MNGHLSTFVVRAFVFEVFGAQLPDIRRPAGLHEARFGRYLSSIWPVAAPVRLPPADALDDASLSALTDGGLAG